MIYNSLLPDIAGGPINLNSNAATMKLKPLQATSPDPNAIYNNIVIFQDRTLDVAGDDVTLNGSASVTDVEGMVYVPGGDVKLNGNGGSLTLGQVIANTYQINGGGGKSRSRMTTCSRRSSLPRDSSSRAPSGWRSDSGRSV